MSPSAIDRIEFAHAILINNNSFASGKTIASLNIEAQGVYVVALRRDDEETESPAIETMLQNQDTLVVRGKPIKVEKLERYLQRGEVKKV
jgi:CPA2 family monovalent cation:H+ antiporter-2